jgi:hypothetical protein
MPAINAPEPEPDVAAMLQIHMRPTLSLSDLIPASPNWIPFHLVHLDYCRDIPTMIFLDENASEQEIEQELLVTTAEIYRQ